MVDRKEAVVQRLRSKTRNDEECKNSMWDSNMGLKKKKDEVEADNLKLTIEAKTRSTEIRVLQKKVVK